MYSRPGLPSGTILRFALLAIAVLTASMEMSNTAATLLFAHDGAGLGCWFAIGDDSAFWQGVLAGRTPTDAVGYICLTAPVPSNPYFWGYVGTAVLLAAAVAVYWLLPVRRSRRRGLVPVEQLDAALDPVALRAELVDLVARANRVNPDAPLPVPPRFVVDCASLDASAVVFGRMRAPVVCLHAGLLVVRATAPEKFRAVVLHELAHIRNFDVGLAYSVLALWRAFVAVVLVPYVLVVGGAFAFAALTGRFPGIEEEFWPASLPELVRQVVKALVLVTVVFLARADTLRHRELVADAEAVKAGADPDVWIDAAASERSFAQRSAQGAETFGRGRLRRATELLRPHPSWQQRGHSVRLPYTVYGLSRLQFFLIGCTTLISVNTVARVWGQPLGGSTVSGVASGIVLLATWHGLMRARLAGTQMPSGLTEGLALGCGLVVGQFTAGIGTTSRWWPTDPALPLVLLALPALSALWVTWTAQNGQLALLQGIRPRAAVWATGFFAWVLGVMLVQWWQTNGYTALAGHPIAPRLFAVERAAPALAEQYPGTASVIAMTLQYLDISADEQGWDPRGMALWAHPVLVQLPRFFGGSERRARTRAAMHAEGAGFGGVTAAGLAGGLIACAVTMYVAMSAATLRPGSGLDEESRLVLLVWWTAMAVWGGSAVAALVASARMGPVWMPRAVTACAIAQIVGLLGFVATMTLGGCVGERPRSGAQPACGRLHTDVWESLPTLLALVSMSTVGAAVVAVGTATTVRGVRRAARRVVRRHPAPGVAESRYPTARTWVVRVGVGAMLAVTVVSCHTAQEIAKTGPVTEALGSRIPVPSFSVTDRTRSLQTLAWDRTEGRHVADVLGHYDRADLLLGARPLDLLALHTACEDLRAGAALAQQARPFPEHGLHARWTADLRRTMSAADACIAWTHVPTDPQRLGFAESRQATSDLFREFVNRVNDAESFWR